MSDVKETLRILRELGAAWWNFLVLHLFMQAVQKCNPERNLLKVKAVPKELPHWMRQFCKRTMEKLFICQPHVARKTRPRVAERRGFKQTQETESQACDDRLESQVFGRASERDDAKGPLQKKLRWRWWGRRQTGRSDGGEEKPL